MKFKRKEVSALKRVRQLFPKTEDISDTDDSFESDSSNELLQHIPLESEIPSLENITLAEHPKMSAELVAKIDRIGVLLEALTEKSERHELLLGMIDNPQVPEPIPGPNYNRQEQINDFFRIPDPIKSIPNYDGNRKQLSAWITTAENTLNIFKHRVSPQLFTMYETAVINKINDKARDIICLAGNPQDFETVKNILTTALGDRQELSTYKCQLWRNKMSDSVNIHKYYQKSKEILQNIKTIAKQDQAYRENWAIINKFIDEDGLAAFIAGLHSNYFGHAQAARPKDIEDAYAFLCKFRSQEITAETTRTRPNNREQHKDKFTNKPTFSNNQTVNKPPFKDPEQNSQNKTAEPMEIGSTRSKLTLNKRTIHNNEINETPASEGTSGSDADSEHEVETNFQLGTKNPNIT